MSKSTGKWEDRDKAVKNLLNKVRKVDGGWEIMLNILERRAYRNMLVDRRKELGMTQEELAKKLDITQPAVAQFENELYPDPRLSTLRRYATALELKVRHDVVADPVYPDPDHTDPDNETTEKENNDG